MVGFSACSIPAPKLYIAALYDQIIWHS